MGTSARPPLDLLDHRVMRWVTRQGWTGLREVQELALPPLLEGKRDVLIVAETASGKTEAAVLPVICRLLDRRDSERVLGVQILYVSPLKALVNDQNDRLLDLCRDLDIPVHRWHGDVPGTAKRKLMQSPGGVLIITPESLEAVHVRRGSRIPLLLGGLLHVVVDEVHALIGTERGAQVQSLLHRVELALGRRVPRVGLSATVADLEVAVEFLRPQGGRTVEVISCPGHREVRLQVRGYREHRRQGREAGLEDSGAPLPSDSVARLAIGEHLFRTLRGSTNLVFANSRRAVEQYSDLLARLSEGEGVPNEFWAHHGSLAKSLREDVEDRLRDRPGPSTAVCTSTLELGIDIGTMASIAQIGAPPSVSALRQRLGRSGRREEPAVLRVYVAASELTEETPPPHLIRAELVQAVAMVRLMLSGWLEPPQVEPRHMSTLVQQLLSLIAERSGVRPEEACAILCGEGGAFRRVAAPEFASLLREMGKARLIEQAGDRSLHLGPRGERIVGHYTFYAAFTTPQEYRLVTEEGTIGALPISRPLFDGETLVFAGRRWVVTLVDDRRRQIRLSPAGAGSAPEFEGSCPVVSDGVRAEMVAVYREASVPEFLDPGAADLLAEGRHGFAGLSLDQRSVVEWGGSAFVFPWRGDRVLDTLAIALRARGLRVSTEGVAVCISGASASTVYRHLRGLRSDGPPDGRRLAEAVTRKFHEKFDRFLPHGLLCQEVAARTLDPSGTWAAIEELLVTEPAERLRAEPPCGRDRSGSG